MKLSRYNFLKTYGDDTIFFNAATCALAIVDDAFMQAYHAAEQGTFREEDYDAQLVEDMQASGCLVDDDADEIRQLSYYRNVQKYSTDSLALTIAPTLACNFRCTYCFEHHVAGIMTKECQDALIAFVERYLPDVKDFAVTWYGGAPLLAENVIYSLSERFVALCEKYHVNYSAFIITNGSLLTEDDVAAFRKYHITGAQITLDGPQRIHDARRVNCAGESTYDKLLWSINTLLDHAFDVIVRVNVDKENVVHLDELLQELKTRITRYHDVKIDFGKVAVFTDVCKSVESACYDAEQYADVLLPLYDKVLAMGFEMNKMTAYPNVRYNYCCADYVHSYVVDVDGYLYKCWNQVGTPSESCGNVSGTSPETSPAFLGWVERNPMDTPECRDCRLLPVCMGGCPDLARKSEDCTPACDTIKFNIDKVIEFYYQHLKGENAQ